MWCGFIMAKKKFTLLTIKDKADILKKLSAGFSINSLAKSFSVHRSTITRVKRNEHTIKKFVAHSESGPGKRKTLKSSEFPKMERALFKWFATQRANNLPITSDMLKEKAKLFHAKIQEKSGGFHASNGWVANFKKRHGIRRLKICGEKLSNKTGAVNPFLQKLNEKIADLGLEREQIYNADESGLFWKLLPDKTLVRSKETSAPGHKISKERITFLACTNAAGNHRVKLMVIGKSSNPRSFKNFTDMPVVYKGNKSAWMTMALFEEWFHRTFVPEVCTFLVLKKSFYNIN